MKMVSFDNDLQSDRLCVNYKFLGPLRIIKDDVDGQTEQMA
jgi:hypothetical protein